MATVAAKFECTLLGHKERSFDVRFSENGSQLLSASQDGTARLWDLGTRKALAVLKHSSSSEVLRAAFLSDSNFICTSGADGYVRIWGKTHSDAPMSTLSILKELHHGEEQVYVCEPSKHSSVLTAASNSVYLWDLSSTSPLKSTSCETKCFVATQNNFGGPRNPDMLAFVFDAKLRPCTDSIHAAVALSDGTVRIIDFRDRASTSLKVAVPDGIPRSLKRPRSPTAEDGATLSLNETLISVGDFGATKKSHVTSVSWAPDGQSVIATMGSGDIAVLDITRGCVRGIFQGCHMSSCFGSEPLVLNNGDEPHGYMSWSSDGSIRIWDEHRASDFNGALSPLSVFSSRLRITMPNSIDESGNNSAFPIYGASSHWSTNGRGEDTLLVAVAGGGAAKQFIGSPIHIVNVTKSIASPSS